MNKKILSVLIAGATILSSSAIFAEDEYATMLISEEAVIEETVTEEAHSAFISITAEITGVGEETLTAKTELEEIIINKNMLQMSITTDGEMVELTKGDSVTLFVREDTPMVLSLPAEYSPSVIVKNSEEAANTVMVDSFTKTEEGSYINQAESLVLNIAEETEIIKLSREMFDGNLDGCDLVVIYNMATFSIPAQTTPSRVIVLNKAAQELPAAEETFTKITAGESTFDYEEAAGAEGMVPVRAIAEALGFTVEWDAAIPAVMINNGMFSFAIGEDHYTRGKMMPITLGQAAVCVCVGDTGVTHVPVSFFTEVLGLDAVIADGTLTISIK
ncbi:MAG: copper amine oxidase N-terminal domain-containing protein [Clostridia bacterium]|nr:copper amine oxidase N-terminal domain-containing protein [Clostridia bacterium]